ncbi:MAG TPA: IclR family transcriptional regulator [Rhodoblastus sp.]|nr:IclR family transcriptional regulator [Rhodoblastus sp.]
MNPRSAQRQTPRKSPESPSHTESAQRRAAGGKQRPATERALTLLEAVASAGRPTTLKELEVICELPAATTFRLCGRLQEQGYLMRDADPRRFSVGPRLMRLGLEIVRAAGPANTRRNVLSDLVDAIGETCNLTCPSRGEVLYLDRVETKWPLRMALEPGSRVPIHCTASGKLFLAHMPEGARDRLLAGVTLTRNSPKTIITIKALLRDLEKIARNGYSTDNEEFLAGLIAVAVPVRDANGKVVAAVACHAPVARMSLAKLLEQKSLLENAAARMTETFI